LTKGKEEKLEEVGKKGRYRNIGSVCAFVILVGVAVFEVQAFGDPGFEYSYVGPPPTGEANHAEILHNIYDGAFTKSGVNYSNGTVSAFRAYDTDGNEAVTLNLLTHTLDDEVDQIWTDGQATVTARAKYAGYNQSFGWNGGGGTGTTYHELLTDANLGQDGVTLNVGGDFLWGYQADGEEWWSLNSENSDEDHMVTYKIEGLDGLFYENKTVWLLFLEDLPFSQADRDYNDFVVEISAIPEPATAFMLIAGIAILLRKR
jgi:hypothetical protein